ncbi:MAG: hypothetical protein WAV54_02305 [Acidimicrobiales bacterium]
MGSAGDHFSTVIGKTIKGHTYYYVREVARVGGKPKVISQRYLAEAADIEAAMAGATVMADRTRHLAFGDLAAVWSMFERLKVAEIIDEVVGSRRTDAAALKGTYIALATANRVVDPCSKRKLSDWWKNTSGDRLVRLPAFALDHRRSWDAMDAIGKDQLQEIERRVAARLPEVFSVDLWGLVLDLTNFATYVGSSNDRAVDDTLLPGLTAFETRRVVFGVERRIVVTHSENLHAKQDWGFGQTLSKACRQLSALAARLARGKTRKSREKAEAEIAAILKPRWLSRVISTSLAGESPPGLRLIFRTKAKAERPSKRSCSASGSSSATPTTRSGCTSSTACSPF